MEYDNFAEKMLYLEDQSVRTQVEQFLTRHGIHLDQGLEYIVGIYDGDLLIATGAIRGKTLRCIAVDTAYQGTGVLNRVISHLISVQYARGNTHLFIYTKPASAQSFKYLGFYQIAEVKGKVVLLENKPNGLKEYLQGISRHDDNVQKTIRQECAQKIAGHEGYLKEDTSQEEIEKNTAQHKEYLQETVRHKECVQKDTILENLSQNTTSRDESDLSRQNYTIPTIAGVVVNCNPFTLGHQYLIETASQLSDRVHVFVVWEDQSVFPAEVRYQLVVEGTRHLPNVIVHQGRDYIISNATFPSYFIKDEGDVVTAHAELDLTIFSEQIAPTLGIKRRFVGEEPYCQVTRTYNQVMQELLPAKGIEVMVIPRKSQENQIISASTVRNHLKNDELDQVRALVPESTFKFLQTSVGREIVKKIKQRDGRH